MGLELVAAVNDDSPAIIRVIRSVYDEYGFTWESGGYHADLEQIEEHYPNKGGAFWVLREDGEVVATCGVHRHTQSDCELARLYLLARLRGQGLGSRLFRHTIEWSRAQGFRRMFIWSDVKLTLAHSLYFRHGAKWIGQRRCNDPDNSLEQGFLYTL